MNTRRRTVALLAALLFLAAVVGGALWLRAARTGAPAPDAPGMALAGATIGGPFRLVDQNGRTVTDADLKGRYALIYFGYSFCPDICPTDLQRMSQALTAFEKAEPARGAEVQPVFVTIDPERDTPAALKAYAANFHPRLIALTGSPAAVDAAKAAYKVYAARRVGGAGEYLMDHSSFTYLFGPDGKPIAALDSRAPAADLLAMLNAHVR